jgi:hypothetical protein
MILKINSDHFPKKHKPINLCNGEGLCFKAGTEILGII